MTSSVKDFSIPDFGSAEQNEDMSKDCRLVKVRSNDVDKLEDSSAEEYVGATCGLKDNGKPTTSASKNSMAVTTGNIATGKSLVPLNESSIIYDEETLMKMTDEELKFFENYKRENHAQLMPSLECSICSCRLLLVKQDDNIRIHPAFGVIVCKSCEKKYSDCPFTKDENGHDEYCRWCAKNGRIVCCDTCTNVFCKACLGRVNFLEITSSKCKWSCLVCNNRPLWSQRALCRMVMSERKSTSGRKSPSIGWPAIISKAEKLATDSKALASKLEEFWSKESEEADGSSCHQQKDKVVYCRLLKALDTTLQNLKLLEEKLVAKFELKFGITADQQESSILRQDSTPRAGKQLIVKKPSGANSKQDNYAGFHAGMPESPPSATSNSTKDSSSKSETFENGIGISVIRCFCTDSDSELSSDNYGTIESTTLRQDSSPRAGKQLIVKKPCGANSKQDKYAEVRESPPPHSATSNSTKDSFRKSIYSLSSQATIPYCPSPLPTQEQSGYNSSSNEAEAQPNETTEKTQVPTVEDTLANDESVKFFDTASELSFPDSSSSSFNSESEESFIEIEYNDSDSSSSPEIDLNEKAIKRKSSDSDDSLAVSPGVNRTKKLRSILPTEHFQSSESKEEKQKPKTEQVVAGRSVAGIPVDELQNFSVQQAASFFRCGLS